MQDLTLQSNGEQINPTSASLPKGKASLRQESVHWEKNGVIKLKYLLLHPNLSSTWVWRQVLESRTSSRTYFRRTLHARGTPQHRFLSSFPLGSQSGNLDGTKRKNTQELTILKVKMIFTFKNAGMGAQGKSTSKPA